MLPLLAAFLLGFQVKTEARIVPAAPQDIESTGEDEFAVTLTSKTSQESLQALSRLFSQRGIELSFDNVERNADGVITNIQVSFRKTGNGQTGNYNQNNSGGIQPFRFFTKGTGETGFQTLQESSKTTVAPPKNDPKLLTGRDFLIVLGDKAYEMQALYGKYIQLSEEIQILDPEETQKRFGRTSKDGALIIPNGILVDDFDAAMNRMDAQEAGANEDYLHISKELGAVPVNVNKKVNKSKSQADEMFSNSIFNDTDSDSLNFIEKYRESKLTTYGVQAIQFENTNEVYRSALFNQNQRPLYVIDGEIQPKDFNPDQLDPENIKSINVLKNESATDKYGEKGKYGVIEINLKKEGDEPTEQNTETPKKDLSYTADKITIHTSADGSALQKGETGSKVTITGVAGASVESQESRLIVLNGKVMKSDFDPSTIDPEDIDAIVVLKGDLAEEKYGKKAANGVIEITTKD